MISNRSTRIGHENTPGATLSVYLHMYMIYMNTSSAQGTGRMPEEPILDASHMKYVPALRQGPHEMLCSKILAQIIYCVISIRS
jgi:hypothetical protein